MGDAESSVKGSLKATETIEEHGSAVRPYFYSGLTVEKLKETDESPVVLDTKTRLDSVYPKVGGHDLPIPTKKHHDRTVPTYPKDSYDNGIPVFSGIGNADNKGATEHAKSKGHDGDRPAERDVRLNDLAVDRK